MNVFDYTKDFYYQMHRMEKGTYLGGQRYVKIDVRDESWPWGGRQPLI
jgi:hypothetical protein